MVGCWVWEFWGWGWFGCGGVFLVFFFSPRKVSSVSITNCVYEMQECNRLTYRDFKELKLKYSTRWTEDEPQTDNRTCCWAQHLCVLSSKESGFLYFDFVVSVLIFPVAWQNNTEAVEVKMLVRWRNTECGEYNQHCLSPLEPDLQPSIPFPVSDVSVDQVLGVVIKNLWCVRGKEKKKGFTVSEKVSPFYFFPPNGNNSANSNAIQKWPPVIAKGEKGW